MATLSCAVLLVGCGSDSDSSEAAPDDGPMATYPGADGTGMFSSASGALSLSDGCVVLDIVRGEQRLVPLFPDESVSWNDEQQTIVTSRGGLRLGERYEFGGGGIRAPSSDSAVPEGCPNDAGFFLVGFLPEQ